VILDQACAMPEPLACDGLLVIGDPHVGSRRPGRRTDADWPAPILAKLERCVALANAKNLAPVILGDVFERAVEPDESLKARLIRLFRAFRIRPLANVGNHDIAHTRLSDGDSLAVLGLCDVLDVVPVSRPVRAFDVGGRRLGVGLTPYGQAIPTDVRGLFPDAETVVWFTHHDIAFEGTYPGAVPPFPILGCDLVVNGHIHKTKRPIQAGGTLWTNPGNIARQSVDLLDHAPRAWVLDADGRLDPEDLPFAADVFDLTGRLVEPAANQAVAAALESAFVSLLQAETATDVARSQDGALLTEELAAKFARDDTPEAVRAVVRSLLAEAVERRAG